MALFQVVNVADPVNGKDVVNRQTIEKNQLLRIQPRGGIAMYTP